MNTSTYIGLGLALLGSNLCLLLLLLNVLSWINFLHMDLTPIENFAESILLSPQGYQSHFQTAAVAWLIIIGIGIFSKDHGSKKLATGTTDEEGDNDKNNKKGSWHHIAFSVITVIATLALPHILQSHQHRHPIIRRSVIMGSGNKSYASPTMNNDNKGTQTASVPVQDGDDDSDNKPATTANIQQELVFTVEKMTCGGCGSHVRDLVDANLALQQKAFAAAAGRGKTDFTINKVQVDWRAGVMSVYGINVVDHVDQQAVKAVLEKDGYPTSFLYSQ